MLWYGGNDEYLVSFRNMLIKLNNNEALLADNHTHDQKWRNLSYDAKALILYLGFNVSQHEINSQIVDLAKQHKSQLSDLFDFGVNEFEIKPTGRSLFSALIKCNGRHIQPNPHDLPLRVYGHYKRTRKKVKVTANTFLYSGSNGAGTRKTAIYQTLMNKQEAQGCFIIRLMPVPNYTIDCGQHAYENLKQFEFYADEPSTLRNDFEHVANDVCTKGGYYQTALTSGMKPYLDPHKKHLPSLLNKIANSVEKLSCSSIPPVVYLEVLSIKQLNSSPSLFMQLKRLQKLGVKLCLCEQYFDETSPIYPTFLQKMDATHIIGRLGRTKSEIDYLTPSTVRLIYDMAPGELYISQVNKEISEEGTVAADLYTLSPKMLRQRLRIF